MSYILDALRKSEQQRKRGVAPSLLTMPPTEPAPRRSPTWGYGVAAAVLVVVGVAIGMLRPWQAEVAAPPPVALAPASPAQTSPVDASPKGAATPAPAVAPVQSAPASATVAPGNAAPPPASTAVPAPTGDATRGPVSVPAGAGTRPPGPAPAGEVAKAATLPPATAAGSADAGPTAAAKAAPAPADKQPAPRAGEAVAERATVTFAELPLAIQQEFPRLAIQFHLYAANSRERLVGVNDRMLREGDSIQPGLVLEQITPDGMVLSWKGYRFARGAR